MPCWQVAMTRVWPSASRFPRHGDGLADTRIAPGTCIPRCPSMVAAYEGLPKSPRVPMRGYPCWPGRSTTPRSPARVRTWSWARRMIALGGSCADVALRSLAQMSARSAPVSRSRWLHGYQRRRTGREAVAMPQCFATQPPSVRGRYRLMPSRPGAALTVKPQVRASPSMAALWGNVVPTSAPMPLARA